MMASFVAGVSFVCSGNICRSPTAEAVMRHLVVQAGLADRILIDSAGTGAWHVGESHDARSIAVAARRGMPIRGVARQFVREDFETFTHVLVADQGHLDHLRRLAPHASARAKVQLLRIFDGTAPADAEVPDPYYGGPQGFDDVFDMCVRACEGLLAQLRRTHGL